MGPRDIFEHTTHRRFGRPHFTPPPCAMYLYPDLIELVLDQLGSVTKNRGEFIQCLRATSLVSIDWSDPSRRRLYNNITFYKKEDIQAWCSGIKLTGPYGVSRHVRVLRLGTASFCPRTFKAALPHLTSFSCLQGLVVGLINDCSPNLPGIGGIPLDVLDPILTSFADTLVRLQWTQKPPPPTLGESSKPLPTVCPISWVSICQVFILTWPLPLNSRSV